MQGDFFLKNNKLADQNKAMRGGIFFSKILNIHARLFGTLQFVDVGQMFGMTIIRSE